MKSEEEKRKEFEKLYKSQKKKILKEFRSLSMKEKIEYMKKFLNLAEYCIECTDKTITDLFKQQEKFLNQKKRLRELINNKDVKKFEEEFL